MLYCLLCLGYGVASGGAASGGAEPWGAESEGAGSGGAEHGGAEPGGAEPAGVEPGDAEHQGVEPGVTAGAGGSRGAAAASPGGARTRGTGAADTGGVGGAGAVGAGSGGTGLGGAKGGGAGAVDPGAGGVGGTVWPRPYFIPLLQQVLGVPSSIGLPPPLLCPPPDQSQLPLQPASPLPAPSPYTEETGGLIERREPASCPASPVLTARCVPRPCPPPIPGIHAMALRPFFVPVRFHLPPPHASSLLAIPDPSFESTAASALVAELVDFAAASRLDYATALVAESESASPPSVEGECALCTDVFEDRQEEFECLAAAVPCFASMLLAHEGDPNAPDIPTPRSYTEAITGTYVDAVPPSRANIVNGMWIFRLKRPSGSPPAFKARYIARGFSQRQGVDYFQKFSPTPKMTTLQVLLHVAAQRDCELHSLNFITAFSQGGLHEEI
ncbi:unnamed protein product [Closterium sp. NIES-53]